VNPGAVKKNNFIIIAEVKHTVAAVAAGASAETFTASIRMHLHRSVVKAWVAPADLTVKEGMSDYRFSVYAQFDDDTVGNISGFSGLFWRSKNTAVVTVDAEGKLTVAAGKGASPGTHVEIEVTLPADLGGSKASGHVVAEQAWSATPPQAQLMAANAGPGIAKMGEVINILFLSNGFQVGEEIDFDQFTEDAIAFINGSQELEPYKSLKGSINYWKCFIPSNNGGANMQYLAYKSGAAPNLYGNEVPIGAAPAAGIAAWTNQNVVYHTGLPVPSQKALAVADIRAYWTQTIDPDPNPFIPLDATVTNWRDMADIFLANDVDTPLGISFGSRPMIDDNTDPRAMQFHPLRMTRADLDIFFASLTDTTTNTAIGDYFTIAENAAHPRMAGGIVIMISKACRRGGARSQTDKTIALDTTSANANPASSIFLINEVAGSKAVDMVTRPYIGLQPDTDTIATIVHECAHWFGCGDEYSELDQPIPASQLTTVDADAGNLQDLATLKDAITANLNGKQIKWLWHRITGAGIIDAIVSTAADTLEITLKDGHSVFAVHDIAFLRFRAKDTVLTGATVLSKELEVTAAVAATHTLTVKSKDGSDISAYVATFPAMSVVYRPMASNAAAQLIDGTYRFAEMTALNIRKYISDNNTTQTAYVAANNPPTNHDTNIIQMPINLPVPLVGGIDPGIIGLYSGGDRYSHGIMHTAGACIMRSFPDPAEGIAYRNFCAVCRYLIVDRVNPNKHPDIDALYRHYPI
jgi:hypothetical protein